MSPCLPSLHLFTCLSTANSGYTTSLSLLSALPRPRGASGQTVVLSQQTSMQPSCPRPKGDRRTSCSKSDQTLSFVVPQALQPRPLCHETHNERTADQASLQPCRIGTKEGPLYSNNDGIETSLGKGCGNRIDQKIYSFWVAAWRAARSSSFLNTYSYSATPLTRTLF